MSKNKKPGKEQDQKEEGETQAKETLTPEMAKALLGTERNARIQRCRQKIERALAEENCFLDSSFIITAQGNIAQIQIRAKPETE